MPDSSVRDLIDRSLVAYAGLVAVGEQIADEWTYVNDLSTAWRARLAYVASNRAGATVPPEVAAAIDVAVGEIGRIEDPHQAIDWLSTFPQIVLLAVGEQP